MKTIVKLYFPVLIAALCLLSACEDFLTVSPKTEVTVADFYQTEEDFDLAVTGCYQPLQNLYGKDELPNYGAWTMGEMRSDNTTYIYNIANRGYQGMEYVARFTDTSNDGAVSTKYNNDFIIIGRANQILKYIDQATFDESKKNNFKGQALFLRAFAYFDAVQYFGDLPLVLQPATSYEETQNQRVSKDLIYEQIIADASEAARLLPPNGEQRTGQVANGAAYTLLGNVYMVLKQWDNAIEVLSKVSGYELLDDYEALWDTSNKNHAESIFEVQYYDDGQSNLFSRFAYLFLPVLSDPGLIEGYPNSTSNNYAGWNTPTPDLIAAYDPDDKRFDASITFFTGDESNPDWVGGYTNIPYIKKYCRGASRTWDANNNWPVYRYAEVLLFLAEAYNESGNTDLALNYLNRVHAHPRTGLTAYTSRSQSELRELIMNERRIELAFENKRWPDLVRTGRALEVMKAFGTRVMANPQAYYYPAGTSPTPDSYNIDEHRLIFPIPQREMRLNPTWEQNPDY